MAPVNKAYYHPDFRLGILGGGQLGRMFIQEAINLNVGVHIMDPDPHAPCRHIATTFEVGSLKDYDAVYAFGKDKDVLTVEIEHVNVDALFQLEAEGVAVYPTPALLKIVQDKGLQKQFYQDHGIPTSPFRLIESVDELPSSPDQFPIVQKMRKGGYDGRGVTILKSEADLSKAFEVPSVLEELVDFRTEISVIVARNPKGETSTFPAVDMAFNPEANLVEFLFAPSGLGDEIEAKADQIARKLADATGLIGILAVEMFVTKDGEVIVNEMAPRPHNSGHHTIEANITSQYYQHLRAILDLPLGHTDLVQSAVMVNLLGANGHTGDAVYEGLDEVLEMPGVHVHLYGKKTTKPFRKMGHVTVTSNEIDDAIALAKRVKETLRIVTQQPETI